LIRLHADLIDKDFGLFLILVSCTVFALIVGIAFHEASHAFMATSLGDTLPRRQGRTTLNPLAHLDPAGTVLMLLVGFGWGKPVQFNPFGLKMSPKMASFFVALAGPMSNFVMAGLLAIPIQLDLVPFISPFSSSRFLLSIQDRDEYIGLFFTGAVYFNCLLGVFNLIPIPPLDGFKVALGLLPDDLAAEYAKLDQYGVLILIVVLFILPYISNGQIDPVYEIMVPSVRNLVELFTGVNLR
jgi:Zn-dependent protease